MTQTTSDGIKEWVTSPESYPSGINCTQVEIIGMAYPHGRHLLKMVHNRAGYKTTASSAKTMRGVININFSEKASPLEVMTEEELKRTY